MELGQAPSPRRGEPVAAVHTSVDRQLAERRQVLDLRWGRPRWAALFRLAVFGNAENPRPADPLKEMEVTVRALRARRRSSADG